MNKEDITKKSTYFYNLPEELIAQTPVEPRDNSRLLVYHKDSHKIEHKIFHDIVDYFKAGDVLVINNTRVLPARLYGVKTSTGAKIEILLQKRIDLSTWSVVAKPTKRLSCGTVVKFSDKLSCVVLEVKTYGECIIKFDFVGTFEECLYEVGQMPLPHYIHEKLKDKERYQTVYSKEVGSSAAPTAGLHFTPELLQKLRDKGVEIVEVLLHVGLGTFRPVKEDNILNHEMHTEYCEVTEHAAERINLAKRENRRVIACGTTSVRTLESAATKKGEIKPGHFETNIFIYPGYEFKIIDGLITNFHLPESTLIMLVSAFLGVEETLRIYNIAVEEKYRFFSFGDANLYI